jgi:hypothetical protein
VTSIKQKTPRKSAKPKKKPKKTWPKKVTTKVPEETRQDKVLSISIVDSYIITDREGNLSI